MSLLVFGSANKIAHGVIRRLASSGAYEKIVCADLYPTYWANERFYKFRDELGSGSGNTTLTDIQIQEKSDLARAISNSSHVVYITHDYYTLTASKLNLIKTVAELAKRYNTEKFVALTPVEHDHYGEKNPYHAVAQSEQEALSANPDMVHLKTDITFGRDSTVVDGLIRRIVNEQPINMDSSTFGQYAHPIHTDDVAAVVERILKENITGRHFALEGPERVTLEQIVRTLERYCGESAKLNESWVEKILSPTSANLITERLYCPDYINTSAFFKLYRPLDKGGLEEGSNLLGNPKSFSSTYEERGVEKELYRSHTSDYENAIKRFFY
jgi:nucleoside-diphosphate-sugar epimerase